MLCDSSCCRWCLIAKAKENEKKKKKTKKEEAEEKEKETEKEKNKKRKRLKAIKSKNRVISKETEQAAVQQSWQKFVQKGAKKALVGIVKKSQFETPEEFGSKVGVTNSGKGLTVVGERKKNKF